MILLSEELKSKIKDSIENLGFYLYYIDREEINGKDHIIIYINKEGYDHSISIDDCVLVTHELNEYIDDYIQEEYVLEVSSSGIYRTIFTEEHLREVLGDQISVNVKKKIKGYEKRLIEGYLDKIDEDNIVIDGTVIEKDNIKKINFKGRKND